MMTLVMKVTDCGVQSWAKTKYIKSAVCLLFVYLFLIDDLFLQVMELLLTNEGYELIGAKIFEKLDNPSIAQARLVNRNWADFIYNQVIQNVPTSFRLKPVENIKNWPNHNFDFFFFFFFFLKIFLIFIFFFLFCL